jgi:hypothetical protein|tara:strand:- start:519 stop:659 length:141 start_codon:yes stop_codon:yes gene_type:complete
MKKGEFNWETLAKFIIIVVVLVIVVYLIIIFKDRMVEVIEKVKDNF